MERRVVRCQTKICVLFNRPQFIPSHNSCRVCRMPFPTVTLTQVENQVRSEVASCQPTIKELFDYRKPSDVVKVIGKRIRNSRFAYLHREHPELFVGKFTPELKLTVSRGYLSRLELGGSNTSLGKMEQFMSVFGCSWIEYFGERDYDFFIENLIRYHGKQNAPLLSIALKMVKEIAEAKKEGNDAYKVALQNFKYEIAEQRKQIPLPKPTLVRFRRMSAA